MSRLLKVVRLENTGFRQVWTDRTDISILDETLIIKYKRTRDTRIRAYRKFGPLSVRLSLRRSKMSERTLEIYMKAGARMRSFKTLRSEMAKEAVDGLFKGKRD